MSQIPGSLCSESQLSFLARVTMQTVVAVRADSQGAVERAQAAIWRVGREPYVEELRAIMAVTGYGDATLPLRPRKVHCDEATSGQVIAVGQITELLARADDR